MSTVKITPSKTGKLVTPYESNSSFAYVQLEQTSLVSQGGWMREQKKSALLKGETVVMEKLVRANSKLELPGTLVVTECLEGDIPEAIAGQFLNPKVSFEEAIEPFVKRAGNDSNSVVLTKDGQRVLRFTSYDASGEGVDTLVQHDNSAEVKAARIAADAADETGKTAKLGK